MKVGGVHLLLPLPESERNSGRWSTIRETGHYPCKRSSFIFASQIENTTIYGID
jgi:hypothetical protein